MCEYGEFDDFAPFIKICCFAFAEQSAARRAHAHRVRASKQTDAQCPARSGPHMQPYTHARPRTHSHTHTHMHISTHARVRRYSPLLMAARCGHGTNVKALLRHAVKVEAHLNCHRTRLLIHNRPRASATVVLFAAEPRERDGPRERAAQGGAPTPRVPLSVPPVCTPVSTPVSTP